MKAKPVPPTEGRLFTVADVESQPKKRGRRKSTVVEERRPLTREQMKIIIGQLHKIETPKGIKYVNLRLTKHMVIGIRESSGKEFTINLDDLYNAYYECMRFTSPEVKKYIFMGHSPAAAILRILKEKSFEVE